MYAAHHNGQAVRAMFSAPTLGFKRNPPNIPPGAMAQMSPQQRARMAAESQSTAGSLWGLQGSASVNGKQLTLTVVNPHATEVRETEIALRGAGAQSVRATTLRASDIHAHNSFENPRGVEPKEEQAQVKSGGALTYRFAPASVTRLQITLA
jgi:alpha-N-arabinofuranosidase